MSDKNTSTYGYNCTKTQMINIFPQNDNYLK